MIRKSVGDFRWEGVEVHPYKEDGGTHFKSITRQTLHKGENDLPVELRYFEVAPGGHSTLELHHHQHLVTIVRGRGHALVGEEIVEVGEHDTIHVPPCTWHQFQADLDDHLGFLCIVSSERDKPHRPSAADLIELRGKSYGRQLHSDLSLENRRKFGFETRMLHAGQIPDPYVGARAVPIYQTTSYVFSDTEEAAHLFELKQYGNIYSRISNPTTAAFEERMASLENGTGAVAVASGMAAQFTAIMTLLQPGDHIVASSQLYGGSLTLLTHTLKKLSIDVAFVDPCDLKAWESAFTPRTRIMFVEVVGNPIGSIPDLEALGSLARAKGVPLVVDNTFATPYLCRPIEWGATIVVHSATKFIGGHGTSIGGVVIDSGEFDFSGYPTIAEPSPSYHGLKFFETFGHYGFLVKLRAETVRDTGACIAPMNSFLLLQGLETLSLRMDRHVSNALSVAEFLNEHPKVAKVNYAGLPGHPNHEMACKYLPKGPGAVLSFEIKAAGNERQAGKRFIESLQLFSHLANVGDAKSLVIHPASTTHQQLSDAELKLSGITPAMIRLSVGLETTEDLLWDLDQALSVI